jgi:hypothetical protein
MSVFGALVSFRRVERMAAFHPFADLSVAYQAFGFIHSREKILKNHKAKA